jgi:hypothetical protein
MNLKHLDLDLYDLPEDEELQITVFLIAAELQSRKMMKAFASIGCDACFCIPDLCDLVLAFIGFNDRPNELYEYYFDLIKQYCEEVTYDNNLPIREALYIYNDLKNNRLNFT